MGGAQSNTISDVLIQGNFITNAEGGIAVVGGDGGFDAGNFYAGCHNTTTNIRILNNTIAGKTVHTDPYAAGVYINGGSIGASSNVVTHIVVENNVIHGFPSGIAGTVGDVASDYFGQMNPIIYSDFNGITNCLIQSNRIHDVEFGIGLGAANGGNVNNSLQDIVVAGNNIERAKTIGIGIGGGEAGQYRSTHGNIVDRFQVCSNAVIGPAFGIRLSAGSGSGSENAAGAWANAVRSGSVHDNTIRAVSCGIDIYGGVSNKRGWDAVRSNVVENVSIINNDVQPLILVLSGVTYGGGVEANAVRRLVIGNTASFAGRTSVSIRGGLGMEARSNRVEFCALRDGRVGDQRGFAIQENEGGASANSVVPWTQLVNFDRIVRRDQVSEVWGCSQYGLTCRLLAASTLSGGSWVDTNALFQTDGLRFIFSLPATDGVQEFYRVTASF